MRLQKPSDCGNPPERYRVYFRMVLHIRTLDCHLQAGVFAPDKTPYFEERLHKQCLADVPKAPLPEPCLNHIARTYRKCRLDIMQYQIFVEGKKVCVTLIMDW